MTGLSAVCTASNCVPGSGEDITPNGVMCHLRKMETSVGYIDAREELGQRGFVADKRNILMEDVGRARQVPRTSELTRVNAGDEEEDGERPSCLTEVCM